MKQINTSDTTNKYQNNEIHWKEYYEVYNNQYLHWTSRKIRNKWLIATSQKIRLLLIN